ncbi:MAG: SurA N-terminal domain-containing protein [Candidatus Omnitrophota bacterium]
MKKNRSFWILFLCLLLCAPLAASYGREDKIIAVVNKDVITQKDLDGFVNFTRMQMSSAYKGESLEKKIASLKPQLIERLIEDRLILQEAKKSGVKINEDKIAERINEIRSAYPSDSIFQAALKQQGLSQADLETKIREQLLMYNIIDFNIRRTIIIKPTEVTAFYEENKENITTPERREFTAVIMDTPRLASKVFSDWRRNEDPGEIAERYGVSFSNLDASVEGQLKKEVEKVVFNLKEGEVSTPVKIDDKYYIFKLNKIVAPRNETLAESQERIYNMLLEKRMQEKLAVWIDELKGRAYIKIFKE